MDNLTRDVMEAERLGYGCHYGWYKADHPRTRPRSDDIVIPDPMEHQEPRTCKHCGASFLPKRNLKHFCSESCKRIHSAALRVKTTQRYVAKYPEKICIQCGRKFRPTTKTQKCCGHVCAAKRRQLSNILCAGCGVSFKPKSKITKYCCRECFITHWQRQPDKEEMPDE